MAQPPYPPAQDTPMDQPASTLCRNCAQPKQPRLHDGSGLTQWFCINPTCYLSY